ncbi:Arabinose operon protein AraL [compost metagenome]
MAYAALEVLKLPPERCMVIGDSLESDISLGKEIGMKTALVLTGSVSRVDVEMSPVQPDLIWSSIADVHHVLTNDSKEKGII